MTTGATDRSIRQAMADFDYQQFTEGRDWDLRNLGGLLAALQGTQGSYSTTQTQTTEQKGSALGQALGIATTLIGAFYNPVGTAAGMAAGAGSGVGITAWADEAIESIVEDLDAILREQFFVVPHQHSAVAMTRARMEWIGGGAAPRLDPVDVAGLAAVRHRKDADRISPQHQVGIERLHRRHITARRRSLAALSSPTSRGMRGPVIASSLNATFSYAGSACKGSGLLPARSLRHVDDYVVFAASAL